MLFSRAIVRKPCRNFEHGLTTAELGPPDYQLAVRQHQQYVQALRQCGLQVTMLEADERYPDSTFVEDTAVLTPFCAVMTRPGAPSRQGEVDAMRPVLAQFFPEIWDILEPGTLDGGDVLQIGDRFFVGISERTGEEGARQLIDRLSRYGLHGQTVPVRRGLHLKSGLNALGKTHLLACEEYVSLPAFREFKFIVVDEDESYAANSLWINGTVLVPAGFPGTAEKIRRAGFTVLTVDVSEFRKMDGGLTCLSLRF
jgi:dimethylargininase